MTSNIEQKSPLLLEKPANKVSFLTGYLVTDWLFFQACWFALILSQSNWVALGVCVSCLFLAKRIKKQLNLSIVILIFSLGILFDQMMFNLSIINFGESANNHLKNIIPLWLIALWVLFAVFCQSMFDWLSNKIVISLLLGALAGPLTYWGAQKIGSIEILEPILFLSFYATFWALLMAGLSARFSLSDKFRFNVIIKRIS